MRVLLITGGWSNEREVALSGAKGVEASLARLGHETERLDPLTEFDSLAIRARDCDFAFILMHGSPGEDGLIQAVLDAVGLPYQGADPGGSFRALHKAASKQLFRERGLLTPDWEFLPRAPEPGWRTKLNLPVYVKDNTGGSSLDMALAPTPEALREGLATLFAKGCEVLLEEAVHGPELTCAVIGDQALPPILIKPLRSNVFFDYESKYQQGGAEEICPAPVADDICRRLQQHALQAHQALRLKGCSRADFILQDDDLYLLEVNTIPGMTPTSLLPKAAAAAGMDFDALISRLMQLELEHPARNAEK